MKVTYDEIKAISDDLSAKYGGNKPEYFPLAYLASEFNRPYPELVKFINFEKEEVGIDAYYLDQRRGNLYLYIIKWAQNHHGFEKPMRTLIDRGIPLLFSESKEKSGAFSARLKKDLVENQAIIGRIFVHFVYNGNPEEAEKSSVLDLLREELESKKFIIDQMFLGKAVTFSSQVISNMSGGLSSASHTRVTHRYQVNYLETNSVTAKSGETLHLGMISLMDLYKIYQEMDYRFFERNIRAGLSADRLPNREIRASLQKILEGGEDADHFLFNHNGVTISAEKFEILSGSCYLTEPRLLNGAQTVTSLAAFVEKNKAKPLFQKNRQKLFQVQVVVKIITEATSEFITQVTVCNNRQNPVAAWNLRSNDIIQLQLQDKFREEAKVYYERQENAFEELTENDFEEMKLEKAKKVEVKRLAQTFLAMQCEPEKMGKLADVFNQTPLYQKVFKQTYLKKDVREILFFYKMQFRLGRVIKEFQMDNTDRFYFLRGARNLLWCLLIQAVLNEYREEKYEQLLASYGKGLAIESSLADFLKDTAIKYLKPVLNQTAKESPFAEQIKEEKYGFIRTRKFFQECLDNAGVRYGWQKLSI